MRHNYLKFWCLSMSLFIVFAASAQKSALIQEQRIDRAGNPTFVKFSTKAKSVSKAETKTVMSELLNMTPNDEYKMFRSNVDHIGFTHEKFQQYYKGVKVEKGVYIVHSRNNSIESLSGEYKEINNINITPSISAVKAEEKARLFINAQEYLSKDNGDFYIKPVLVIVASTYGKHPKAVHEMVLAYKIDVYASKPLSRDFIYVNAHNGEIVAKNTIIKNAVATGSADTRYSGTQSISTDSYSSSYRLRDYSRGNGIITYNCNESTSYTSAVDFTDGNNDWTEAEYDNTDKDNGALDAHWAGMMTYDYWNDVHGRSSFDDSGALIKTYVHYDSDYDNAYWNGSVFTFGDGDYFDILTSLDVFGHEFGHAVCSYTCDLTYSAESGALNEAFSDIWGCAIEYRYAPDKDTWLMGEDLGTALRSLSDPKSKDLPDTYLGDNWESSSSDYYGVHTNNGPFCYWFYLISEGGSGTNDNSDSYSVSAIGIEKAELIAYRIESVYMTSSSDYADSRTYAIQAAQDLYGEGSQEEISVTDAMYAIGVGDAYDSGSGGTTASSYCESEGSNYSYEWIEEMQLGTYVNSTSGSSYTDYTSSAISVNAGATYTVILTPGFASSTYNEYWKIWIDYDNDTVFSDDELVYDAGALSKTVSTGNITIESGVSGLRRMRVSMKYNAEQTACETFTYGEVEDYNLNITTTTADAEAPTVPTGLVSSDITTNSATVSWTASTDNVSVSGYNVYQDGLLLGSTSSTSYSVSGLSASTTYLFVIYAYDAAGNISSASSSHSVTTDSEAVDTESPTAPTSLLSSSITSSSASLSWTASTDNVGVSGYNVYQDGSLLGSTALSSYSVSSLSASTTYSFVVYAYDAAGNISSTSGSLSVTTLSNNISYCSSQGNNSSYEWIDYVALGSMTNTTSNNGGYADYTSEVATASIGDNTIYFSCGFNSSSYTEYWHVWVDLNQDGTFDDNDELVSGSSSSSSTLSATLTIPTTATLGQTRMRVTMKYNSSASACETFTYGEVEDYTVNIGAASYGIVAGVGGSSDPLGNDERADFNVYPNPANDNITVEFSSERRAEVYVYDISGRLILGEEIFGSGESLDISSLQKGVYTLVINDNQKLQTTQFIKQ